MNKKDYKAISKIIKEKIKLVKPKGDGTIYYFIQLAKELANYFEKEENIDKLKKLYGANWRNEMFNREQFLKDCGVI